MQCPKCQTLLDDNTVFCGNCGQQIAPVQARGATITYITDEKGGRNPLQNRLIPGTAVARPGQTVRRLGDTPPPAPPSRSRPRRKPGLLLSAIVLLLVLAVGTLLAFTQIKTNQTTGIPATQTTGGPATQAVGQVFFFDGANGTGNTDALKITINNLSAAPAGFHYAAWLVDEQTEHAIALGNLVLSGRTFVLNFAGNGGNAGPGANLLGQGNVVEVTVEQGNAQLPTGKVALSATFPPKAFIHIKHLLFSFPTTPGKIGLLDGLLDQTRLLNAQALALQSIEKSQNASAISCIAQSIIDISEGQQGSSYRPLASSCGTSIPLGDGFGILGSSGYAAIAATHASLAATQTDTTPVIRLHAGEVEIATTNITKWVTTLDQDARSLLTHPDASTTIQEIVTLADHAYHGVDLNGDGQIDPVSGEEGATTAYLRGQIMATLTLVS